MNLVITFWSQFIVSFNAYRYRPTTTQKISVELDTRYNNNVNNANNNNEKQLSKVFQY